MKHINLRLFSSFFKIGAFTFGGGWAMISLLEEDIVNKHKWLEKEEFIDNLAIAQSLPGIMAVNVAIGCGLQTEQNLGLNFRCPRHHPAVVSDYSRHRDVSDTGYNQKQRDTDSHLQRNTPCRSGADSVAGVHHRKIRKNIVEERLDAIAISLLIWSNIPVVSSPILYILIGGLFGYFIYSKNFRTAVEKQEGDKQ